MSRRQVAAAAAALALTLSIIYCIRRSHINVVHVVLVLHGFDGCNKQTSKYSIAVSVLSLCFRDASKCVGLYKKYMLHSWLLPTGQPVLKLLEWRFWGLVFARGESLDKLLWNLSWLRKETKSPPCHAKFYVVRFIFDDFSGHENAKLAKFANFW